NRDLDDFTYVVSHDLKEPLITIEGYSSIVQQEFAEKLDEEAVDYLRSIIQATERLKRLIDDLLTLSRVGRARHELEMVNTKDVVLAVVRDLEFTIRENHAVVEIPEHLPSVLYDATQLGLVFRNLISNGIKFNRNEIPVINISVEESTEHYVFCIKDNGIGIPDEYFEKIFVIFQRLHSAEVFPGTGAGLTIVKKIVERHGGKIWVESEVGRGTYFYFSVPRHLNSTVA
ncbi:MAG: ATP-binding protein, partial [Bacteroidota bacterium]